MLRIVTNVLVSFCKDIDYVKLLFSCLSKQEKVLLSGDVESFEINIFFLYTLIVAVGRH